ncbi:MAG: hypothetical protein JWQ09_644 [Segetibacter sp.]|nr:hypothetical protein [Segetibacter sp.]
MPGSLALAQILLRRPPAGRKQGQQGTGRDRNEQVYQKTDISQDEKQDIADQINESPDAITSIKEMGTLSGRDDSAGGSNDRMEEQSTGQETDR